MNLQTELVPQHKSDLLLKNPVMTASGIFGYRRGHAPVELSQEDAAALDDCIILHE